MVEPSYTKKNLTYCNLIIDWTDKEVWDYIKENQLECPVLYDEGYDRIGCIMCCMEGTKKKKRDAERYPRYAKQWLKMAEWLFENHKMPGKYKNPQHYYDCYINRRILDEGKEGNLFGD